MSDTKTNQTIFRVREYPDGYDELTFIQFKGTLLFKYDQFHSDKLIGSSKIYMEKETAENIIAILTEFTQS